NGARNGVVETRWQSSCCAEGQRTTTTVDMVKAWIDKFHRDNKTSEHLGDGAMRFNVGAEFVTAKKCVASEKRVAFAFEIVIIGQRGNLEAAFFHPVGKMRRFAGALFVPKIARNKLLADSEPGIGGKDHVRQFRLRRDQLDLAIQSGKGRVQTAPLLLRQRRFRPARPAHPGINLVLDAVVIRRAKKARPDKIDLYLLPDC